MEELAKGGGGLQAPAGTIHRSVELLISALRDLGGKAPLKHIERIAVMINRAMTVQARSFHTPEHVFDLVDPRNPHIILAALFHDLVYYNVDDGFDPEIRDTVLPSIVIQGNELGLRDRLDPSDAPLGACMGAFGFRAGQRLSPVGGMNEFLSALVMNRLLDGVLGPGELLPATACIEATIPFRKADAAGLTAADLLAVRLRATSRKTGLDFGEERILETVQRAVTFANRDLRNFADESVGAFLDNTWKLLPESNPSLRTQGVYSIHSYRVALEKMEAFLRALEPGSVFSRYQGVPAEAEYRGMLDRATRNVHAAREYLGMKLLTAAILEAIATVSGGDAPMALFMGDIATEQPGSRIEHYLPASPGAPGVRQDSTLHDLLAYGRASASSFDLQNAPLSLFVYQNVGTEGARGLLEGARRMFAGETGPLAFLDGLPAAMIVPIVEGCARMAVTRREKLDAYAAARRQREA